MTAGAMAGDPAQGARAPARTLVAGAIGNLLEWYDFAVYGFFAPVFAANFFPTSSPAAALISAYGVFAASFLVRPLGAILFGHVADRAGRRRALLLSVGLMTVSTVAVGFLPTYAMAGLAAPVLLLLLRLFQGVAIGGEYMTSAVFLSENGPPRWRGTFASFACTGVNGGMLVGSAIAATTAALLPPAELSAWGWRVPFLCGAVLGLMALALRRGVAEEPAPVRTVDRTLGQSLDRSAVRETLPVVIALRRHGPDILRAAIMTFFSGVCFYLVTVYLSTWLQQADHFSAALALKFNTIAMGVLLVAATGFAALSDLVGRKWVLGIGYAGFILGTWPLFQLLHTGDPGLVLAALCALALLAATHGALPVTLAEMFPRDVRCTAVGLSWNVGIGVGGGTAPMVAVLLMDETGNALEPAFYLIATALIAFGVMLTLREPRDRPFD